MSFVSYAQNYEDLRLWRALGHIERGFYLDIGAQHPILDSVSKAFYMAGWRGAHVEPTPAYAAALREDRPDEVVIETAIGEQVGPITFYEIPETGMSTAVAEIARSHNDAGFGVRLREIPVIPLSKIFAEIDRETIHWMKVDVEGMERDVIASWGDASIKPWVLVIESVHPSSREPTEGDWIELVLARGYQEVAFDGLSRYFVSDEHADLARSLALPPNIFDDFNVTRYHFSNRAVVAQDNESIERLRNELSQTRAELDTNPVHDEQLHAVEALSQQRAEQLHAVEAIALEQADQLQVAADALAREQARSAALEAEAHRQKEMASLAQAEREEAGAARAELSDRLLQAEQRLTAQQDEIAAAHVEISQREEALRAVEAEHAEAVVRHGEASARARSLLDTLLADYAQLERSRDELQAKLGAGSSADASLQGELETRLGALESQITALTQELRAHQALELTSTDEAVEAVVREISSEAESASAGPPPVLDAECAPMTLEDLLSVHDEQFVTRAYQLLLKRDADPEGLRHYTKILRRGGGRIRVLADLAQSKEARKVDARVPGLRQAVRRQRMRDLLLLRPVAARLFGSLHDDDLASRLRAIENGIGRLDGSVRAQALAVQPVKHAPPPQIPQPVPVAVPAEPQPAQPAPAIVTLDADRMLSAEQWPEVTDSMFHRHWPGHQAHLSEMKIDGRRQLWIIVTGDANSTVPPQTIANLRTVRDAAPFDVEFGSLGPTISRGGRQFASIAELAGSVPADSLVMFIGEADRIDERLPTGLLLEQGWERDFILSDQSYADGGRVGIIPFHGIDHYHLAHVDYFRSRFLASGKSLLEAANAGASSPVEVSRNVLRSLTGKPGKLLHLQFPFIRIGALDLAAVRQDRHAVMKGLAANPPSPARSWKESVSVVICTKDGGYHLDGLVQQLLGMPQIAEILIVSNNTTGEYTLDLLDRLSRTDRCTVFRYDHPFNFSVQCNIAASAATGEHLLLLNDDVSLIGSDWLNYLLSNVDGDQERIAGPLMLYANQSIQHGGMYLGHNDRAGHTFRHQRHPHDAPMFELVAPRQVTCLTGACLLMKRSFYERLNGLDEQLATGFQDVDLSLRALSSGVELVLDPRAIIFHLESISIIPTLGNEAVDRQREREYARFKKRWGTELLPDPWHNRNFYIEDESLRSLRIAN